MKRHESRRYGEIDRELEKEPREYFVGDFGHGYAGDMRPPGFGNYPESWTTRSPHVGRGPKNYRRSDERIAERAFELARSPRSGRMTIAHRFIGGIAQRNESQSVKRTAENKPSVSKSSVARFTGSHLDFASCTQQ